MGKIFATMLLHFVIPFFDMQHDHVLKKSNFDLLTPTPGSRGWMDCRHNICNHAAELVIPFNLICNMTLF